VPLVNPWQVIFVAEGIPSEGLGAKLTTELMVIGQVLFGAGGVIVTVNVPAVLMLMELPVLLPTMVPVPDQE
jgi:hypothetical protein